MSDTLRNKLDPSLPIRRVGKSNKKAINKMTTNDMYKKTQEVHNTNSKYPHLLDESRFDTTHSYTFESPRQSNITVKNFSINFQTNALPDVYTKKKK